MEMQNVLKQMTEMLSGNVSTEIFPAMKKSMDTDFSNVMKNQTKKDIGLDNRSEVFGGTRCVQNMNDKRQQELQERPMEEDRLEVAVVDGAVQVGNVTVSKEQIEEMQATLKELKEQVSDVLEIDLEQLEVLMSELGLQFTDLFDPSKVQQLVLAVAGEDSNVAFLLNEDINTQVNDILAIASEVSQEICDVLSVKEDEFLNLLPELPSAIQVEEASDVRKGALEDQGQASEVVADMPKQEELLDELDEKEVVTDLEQNMEEISKEVVETMIPEEKEVVVSVTDLEVDKTPVKVVGDGDVAQPRRQLVKEEKVTVEVDKPLENNLEQEMTTVEASTEDSGDRKEKNSDNQSKEQISTFEQITGQIANARAEQVEFVQNKVEVVEQMHQIVEQVVEQIKVTITADTSEMSMQLNPENLGKVNLSVVMKEGHITAQFVTENELARQALETQIQQLRDTLGEQGLKVDKVEVSVSDFSFQQGNEANAEQQKEEQRNEQAKQLHRNLNLSNLEELGELTEEERLAANIMRSNGSQIDYTA